MSRQSREAGSIAHAEVRIGDSGDWWVATHVEDVSDEIARRAGA